MNQNPVTRSKGPLPRIGHARLANLAVASLWPLFILVILCAILHAPISLAGNGSTVLYVATSGKDNGDCSSTGEPCRTIQYAVDQAASGDEIRVAGGTYTGSVTIERDLGLYGGFTTTNWVTPDPVRNRTTVDAQASVVDPGRVISIPNTAPDAVRVSVEGFELEGGNIGSGIGAGCYNAKGHLILIDNVIHDNQAPGGSGGGVGVASTAELTLRGNRIYSNSARRGGSVYVDGTASIESNDVASCSASLAGGGIYVEAGGTVSLTGNLFYANSAVYGGVIYSNQGDFRILNDTYYSNHADTDGGAIYAYNCKVAITNTLIISNTASDGGGIYENATEELIVSHNDFFGNSPEAIEGSPTISVSNRITNPQFIDPQNYNLHLSPGSPAIDAGIPGAAALSDVDGQGRPFGPGTDRGADEYTPLSDCYARVGQALTPTDTHRVYAAVQPAVDAAVPGSMVKVAGHCTDAEPRGGLNQTVYLSKSLTLRGAYTVTDWTSPGYGPTVLDGQGLRRVLYVTGTAVTGSITPVIENLHVTGGQGDYGAGVYVGQNVSATLQNSVIYRNEATQNGGGGVYNQGGLLMRHDTLYDNTASQGAAIFAANVVTLENSAVVHNHATLSGGGAIYAEGVSFTLSYNDFYANTSPEHPSGAPNHGNVDPGATDLSVPPGFVDPAADDFHLAATSELINAADPASVLTADFEGHQRPTGPYADIGADESLVRADLSLSPAPSSPVLVEEAGAIEGQTITFTHTLTNDGDTGAGSDTVIITSANSGGWTTTLSGITSTVVLSTGASQTFTVSVTAPETITTIYNRTTITATSAFEDDVFDVVEDVIVRPGVTLTPDILENADPGEVVTFTHTLVNAGDGPDTFSLSTSSSLGWSELLTPTGEVALASDATASIILRAQVPYTAPVNLEDVTTIRATSSYSVGISDQVTDTVIANPTIGDRFVAVSGNNGNNNCTDQSAPCRTIAYAVNQAAWGDTVHVAQGTYNESDVRIQDDVSVLGGYMFTGREFSLPSGGIDPANYPVIDAGGVGRGLRIQVPAGYHPLVRGFTIRDGSTSGVGGAIYVQAGSAPTLTHLILQGSSATRGGGIYVEGGSPILQHVTISNTVADTYGGGLYVNGGDVVAESVVISGATAASGGGIYVAAGSLAGRDLRLAENQADDDGQGGSLYQAGGTVTLSRTRVLSNVAGTGGGFYSAGGGDLTLRNSLIYSNTTTSGAGGGIYKGSGALTLVNDTLYGNQAQTYGGGVFESGSSWLVISNTIMATNTAASGGGLYREQGGGGSASIDYNDFWDNAAAWYPDSNVSTGVHTFAADPLFADPASGDFHIVYESPCVDAGDPNTGLDVDFEGDRRPYNQGFDVGADELAGCLAHNENTGKTYGILQRAIDEAAESHVIRIAGICRGVQPRLVNGQIISQTAFISKSLTLAGGYEAGFNVDPVSGPVSTTLDARGLGRALVVTGTEAFVHISRLRLIGGDAAGLGGGPGGGAGGGGAGGGVYNHSKDLYLRECTITGNRATYGGGIYNAGETLAMGGEEEGQPTRIVSNTATFGGGLYNVGASTLVSQTALYSNTASTGGGVFHAGGLLQTRVITAARNVAPNGSGGGFYNEAQLDLQRSLVVSNTAANGAGLYNAESGDLTLINTMLANNDAAEDGGGLYNLSTDVTVRHDTFYANSASDQGGGVYHDGDTSSPIINSSLIVENTANAGGGVYSAGVDPSFDYNDVYGNDGDDYDGNLVPADGTGNLSADPGFIATDPESSDFLRIPSGSPAEDAGDPTSPVITDIEGEPRPTNQGVDIGADEVGGCYVRVNGKAPTYGNVQVAIEASSAGDKLHVAGTCQGVNVAMDGGRTVSQTAFLTKSLSIRGGYTLDEWTEPDPVAHPTALDAMELGRVVYVTNTAVISVTGIHLRGGTADGSTTLTEGGAIFVGGNGTLTVTQSPIYSNTAVHGGALYNQSGDVALLRNQIYSNTATHGGAAYGAGGETTLDSNRIYGNQAVDGGAYYHDGGSAWVQNNVVRQNQAGGDGGGVYNDGTGLILRHNTLYENEATDGGGLYTTNGDPTVVNNIFAHNTATSGTSHAIHGPSDLEPDYNDVYPSSNAYGGDVDAGAHSLSVSPSFVDAAGGDFHLRDDSPLIDRGDPTMTLLHDFDEDPVPTGDYRPSDQGFDIGADERKGCWARIEGQPDRIYGNPQRAIAHSIAGDTIQITVGECRGVHPYDDGSRVVSQTIHVTQSLTLHGGFSRDFSSGGDAGPGIYPDPNATTVNPQGLGRAILVTDVVSTTMRRLILVEGDAAGLGGGPTDGDAGGAWYFHGTSSHLEHVDAYSSTAAYGGAFYNAGNDVIMLNSWINYNTATEDGGAVYNASGVITMTVDELDEGTRVYSNTAGSRGGGVFNGSGTVWLTDNNLALDPDASISRNQADKGGFLYNESGQAYLEKNDLFDNHAHQRGGALYNASGNVTVEGNGIFENLAEKGGALYNASGQMAMRGNDIHGNEAKDGGSGQGGALFNSGAATLDLGDELHDNVSDGDGGAIYNAGGSLSIWNALIYENSALDQGGGIYGADDDSSILHNTFYSNTAQAGTSQGGAIYLANGSPTIKNNIFDANTAYRGSAVYGSTGDPVLDYNDYWPESGNDQVEGTPSVGPHSLRLDPDYVDLAERDLHLKSTSPLIDEAEDGLGVTRDLDGDPRPVNRGPDVGADEYSACLAQLASTGETYGRIQAALDAAGGPGDTVKVAEGICEESIAVNQDVTISGSWDKEFSEQLDVISTTVDALGDDRVVTIEAGASSVAISKMRLTNGHTSGDGGGISSEADQVTLADLFVEGNHAGDGGGIWLNAVTATVEDTYVGGNQASGNGGGVYLDNGTFGFQGVTVDDNEAPFNGGGVYNAPGSDVDMCGGGIYDNDAGTYGGGVYNATGAVADIHGGSPVYGNQAQRGGGIYNSGGTLILASKQVNDNTAQEGGGIYAGTGSTLDLVNLGLRGNQATDGDGGGLYRNDGSGSATIYHATIYGNDASGKGGGVYNAGSTMVISASIVSGNAGSEGSGIFGDASVNVAYTLRWENAYDGASLVTGNINENPHLRPFSGGDLLYTSPAIDAVPTSASSVMQDRFAQARPQICAKDMGRDEFKVLRKMAWLPGIPDPDQATLAPTESVTYTYQLRNESQNVTGPEDAIELGIGTGYTETVTVTLGSSQGWAHIATVSFSGGEGDNLVVEDGYATFDLGPGGTASVAVSVTVPAGTLATVEDNDNTKEVTTLTYEARQCPNGPARSATSDPATTRVEEIRQFAFGPDNSRVALPGQTLTYTHALTNTGNITDTYSLFPKVGFYASAEIAHPPFGQVTLSPAATSTVVVSVTINAEAASGLTDETSVLARPDADPSLEMSSANNTTISPTTGTRHVSLAGQDSLVDESELKGTNYEDNNCTQPDVAACRTIQQAIDQATAGDLIKIAQGVYTDVFTITRNSQVVTQTAFVDQSVTLQGGYDDDTWEGGDGAPPDHVAHPTTIDPQGAGRALYVVQGVTVTLDRLIVRNGAADGLRGGANDEHAGGGIYNEGAQLTLNADRVYSSTAELGGGLYHASGTLTVTNSLLHGNAVITNGGAIYAQAGTVTLLNSTFHDNQANGSGGALYAAGGTLAVTNTIVANNGSVTGGALDGAPSTASLDYNLFHNNTVTDTGGAMPAPSVPHDVLADPLFADLGADPPDLRLQTGSPAANAGDPTPYPGQTPWDYGNAPRIDGRCVDLGAYELVICPQPLTGVSLAGPLETTQDDLTTFTASVTPPTATTPVSYTWQATEYLSDPQATDGVTNAMDLIWATTGTKSITVTAANCGGADAVVSATHTITVVNHAPVADAGDHKTVDPTDEVALNGSESSDLDGDDLSYGWTQTGGVTVTLSSATTVSPTFIAPRAVGALTFTLAVTDSHGLADPTPDQTVVTVRNVAPEARAGGDKPVRPGDEVSLDGSASSDPNDDPLSYGWTQIGGVTVTLSGATAVSPTFIAPTSTGVLTFSLTVTDTYGLSSTPDQAVVTVENDAPTAHAGQDQTVGPEDQVTLDGSGSHDPDDDELTHGWTQIGGVTVTLSTATAVSPTFTVPTSTGVLTFALTVTDTHGLSSAPDEVVITVENHAPTANAGDHQTVDPAKEVTLSGSESNDVDGDDLAYGWTQIGGISVTLSTATAVSPTFIAPTSAGALTFTLTVTDIHGLADPTPDQTVVMVKNLAPEAHAGNDRTARPGDEVTLDGSDSSDPNEDPLTYGWTQTGGITVSLSSATAVSPTFIAPTSTAVLTFSLAVTDSHDVAAPTPDQVVVTVSEAPCEPLGDIAFTVAPATATRNAPTAFTASVTPLTATTPVTYTWQASEQEPPPYPNEGLNHTIDFTWSTTGTKTITVTAVNCGGPSTAVSATHTVTVTKEQIAPQSATIHGSTTGITDTAYIFTGTVSPPTTTQPITLAWQATGQEPLTRTDSVSFTWPAMGRQTITMTASNVAGAVVATHTITICYWADLNCDGRVDVGDISDIAAHWRDQEGDPGYRPRYDPDGDFVVTVVDIMRIASQWGWPDQQAQATSPSIARGGPLGRAASSSQGYGRGQSHVEDRMDRGCLPYPLYSLWIWRSRG